MTAHLLLIAIAPVQDFIAQARRTRDLWHGSHLLSELGRATARALVEHGAILVFPALPKGDPELIACEGPLRPARSRPAGEPAEARPPLNIVNRLLAEIPDGIEPDQVARATRAAVQHYWRDAIAGPVRRDRAGLLDAGTGAAWDEQIDTLLELAATWAPIEDGDDGYRDARRAVDRAVAARKQLRDFAPWRRARGGVPMSTLDGARETVLPVRARDRNERLARRYRIIPEEHLDAVGLVKRAGGQPEQFVPIINVALASWLALAAREEPRLLARLSAACGEIGMPRIREMPCSTPLPYEASIVLPSRWIPMFRDLELRGGVAAWGADAGPVCALLRKLSEPYPYVACLVADGDHMGRAIERIGSAEAHRAFSHALSRFATRARELVEQRHLGSLVYAGGDDVLAFVSLPEAVACADALRRTFAEAMAAACPELDERERPTLSVGLGIGHFMDSLGELLALGRTAESAAKGGALPERERRNALAVVVDKRSGGRTQWRAQWSDWAGDPAARLHADAQAFAAGLSSRKLHEIDRTLARLPRPDRDADPAWARLLSLEVRRSLARTRAGDASVDPATLGLTLDERVGYAAVHREVSGWIDRMLVARTFAAATPRLRRSLDGGTP